MVNNLFVYYYHNPYTGHKVEIFAPDFETSLVELGKFTEFSSAYQYTGCREMTLEDLEKLED